VRYDTPGEAAAYRDKYRRSLVRRLSSRRELSLVGRALAQAASYGRILDVPCGAGRLGPTLLRRAVRLVAADLSLPMVREARTALALPAHARRALFARAAAEALPFADGAFDTVLCHRLLHHLAEPAARARLLAELRRVASRWVILSFHDASAPRLRFRGARPRSRVALLPDELAREAAAVGLSLVPPVRRLNGWFSLLAVGLFRAAPR
jgi:SAM-dependent methyltransferase